METTLWGGQRREKPERLEVPREQRLPTWSKNLGSERGRWLSGWDKAVEATIPGRDGLVGNRKSGEGKGNLSTIIREEQSFEGRSLGALRFERGPQGYEGKKDRLSG